MSIQHEKAGFKSRQDFPEVIMSVYTSKVKLHQSTLATYAGMVGRLLRGTQWSTIISAYNFPITASSAQRRGPSRPGQSSAFPTMHRPVSGNDF